MSALLEFREPYSFADTVAANIRAEAARRGVTQRALAKAIGMSQPAASERWNSKTAWTLNEVEAVARVLRTTTSVLCAIRDSNPEPAGLEPLRRLWHRLLGHPVPSVHRQEPISAEVVSLSAYRAARLAVSA